MSVSGFCAVGASGNTRESLFDAVARLGMGSVNVICYTRNVQPVG